MHPSASNKQNRCRRATPYIYAACGTKCPISLGSTKSTNFSGRKPDYLRIKPFTWVCYRTEMEDFCKIRK